MWNWVRLAAAATVVVTGAGCVKRLEIVAIFPDGTGKLVSSFEGDEADLRQGDAVPTPDSGWQVREHLDVKPADSPGEPDKRELKLVASRRIAVGEDWPDSYAAEGTRLARIAVRFPTQVWMEERPEGTYYHFRRVYQGRRMARINHMQERILEQDSLKGLLEKDPAVLSAAEWRALVGAFIEVEREKTRAFLDRAVAGLESPLRQDAWLAARQAAGRAYDRPGLEEEAAEIAKSEDSGDRFLVIEKRIRAEVEANVRAVLAEQSVGDAAIDRVIDGLKLAAEDFEISEDISDEQWRVSVVLPGRIIAHNSESNPDRVKDEAEDGDDEQSIEAIELGALMAELRVYMADGATFESVEWEFQGDALYDADLVLAATSFVPRSLER